MIRQAAGYAKRLLGAVEQHGLAGGIRAYSHAYKGGSRDKIWRNWDPQPRSGDAAIGEDWDLMTSRVRDLFRNEPVTRNLRRAICKLVVGTGVNTFASVLEENAEDYFDRFNFEADELFERWAETECDVERRLNWGSMQALHMGEVTETGVSFMLRCVDPDPRRVVPLCYQLLEADQLDTTLDRPAGDGVNKIVGGIEFGAFNRPAAYWFYDVHPHDALSGGYGKSTRIHAERVIATYLPNRPSEHRGVTWFSANIQSAKDLDWYIGNELSAAALGAALCMVVKREHGAGTGLGFAGGPNSTPGDADDAGNPLVKLGRPFVADIGINDEVSIAESNRPNRDAAPFIKLLLMLHGMASGLSHLRVTGDYSQSSYTSARGAHLDDDAYIKPLQRWFGSSCIRPVREEFHRQAAALGRFSSVTPRAFKRDEFSFQRMLVQPPGREQLDPEMETDAAGKRIAIGLSTHEIECGLRGHSYRRIVLQQKRERRFALQHLGREFELTNKAGAPKPETPSRDETDKAETQATE